MRQKQHGFRKLGFQSLENREMMAANVFAQISNNNLSAIVGTGAAESLSIVSNGNGYTLSSVNGVTINGRSSVTVKTISNDLNVSLGGGNDYLLLANLVVGKNLYINMGSGSDTLIIQNAKIGIDLVAEGNEFTGSQGNDVFSIQNVQTGNNLVVNTGGGKDDVKIVTATVKNELSVNLAGGDGDSLLVANSSARFAGLYDGGKGGRLQRVVNSFQAQEVVGWGTIIS